MRKANGFLNQGISAPLLTEGLCREKPFLEQCCSRHIVLWLSSRVWEEEGEKMGKKDAEAQELLSRRMEQSDRQLVKSGAQLLPVEEKIEGRELYN